MSAREKAAALLPAALEPLAHHKWAPDDLAVVTGVVTTFVDLLNSAIDRAEKAEREHDEAREALARVEALAAEWEGQASSGVKVHCGRRLRAALRGDDA